MPRTLRTCQVLSSLAVESAHTRRQDGIQDGEIGKVERLHGHMLRKLERRAEEACRVEDKFMKKSSTITCQDSKCRVVWEVFAGKGRTTKFLEKYPRDVQTEIFSLEIGSESHLAAHGFCTGFEKSSQMSC